MENRLIIALLVAVLASSTDTGSGVSSAKTGRWGTSKAPGWTAVGRSFVGLRGHNAFGRGQGSGKGKLGRHTITLHASGPGGRVFTIRRQVETWKRQISESVTVNETAIVNKTGHNIILRSMDLLLKKEGLHGSASAYDFDKSAVAIGTQLGGENVCALVPETIVSDLTATVKDIKTRSIKVPVSPTVMLGEFIVREGSQLPKDLPTVSPFLERFCGRGKSAVIVDASTEVDSTTDLTGAISVTVLTINGKVTIHRLPPV